MTLKNTKKCILNLRRTYRTWRDVISRIIGVNPQWTPVDVIAGAITFSQELIYLADLCFFA